MKKVSKASTIIYGRNSVWERLRHNPSTVKEIFIRQGISLPDLMRYAQRRGISVNEVGEKKLHRVKNVADSQGVVARVVPFAYHDFEDLLPPRPIIIFLDHIYDPQNLGVIIRAAACLAKAAAIVIARHDACEVTDAAVHVACGGENFVPVARVSSLSQSVRRAKECGYWIAGGVCGGGKDLHLSDLPFPLALVMGTEASGIRPGLEKHLDYRLSIPMPGAKLSLNVAIAASVFLYELSRQKSKGT